MSLPLILGTNSIKDTSYDVANSLRFNDDDSAFLQFTPSGDGNKRTFTYSFWFKRANLTGSEQYLMEVNEGADNDDNFRITISSSEGLFIQDTESNTSNLDLRTHRLFRDVSAWYHLVLSVDTTQSTSSNRAKLYINGVQETLFSTATYPSQNYDTNVNVGSEPFAIGKRNSGGSASHFDGYMTEIVFIDGQALDPTSFGQFDQASPTIWKPKDVSGLTFGTNGFYLDFENSGSLGADVSGNSNNFTPSNFAATDQSIDTCTNNFCTLNPLTLRSGGNGTLREANLEYEASGGDSSIFGTLAVPAGMKVYFEVKLVSNTAQNSLGIHTLFDGEDGDFIKGGSGVGAWAYKVRGSANDTQYFNNGSLDGTVVSNYSNGTIIGVAVDNANGQIHYSANGTFINSSDPTDNSPAALVTGFGGSSEIYLHFSLDTSGSTNPKNQFNFGSPPYSISSGNSDASGFGNFEYAVPSGYFALCTKNIAEYG